MSLCGVYAGWLEPSETWDVELEEIQHQTQGPEGCSRFVSILVMKTGSCWCCCLFLHTKWNHLWCWRGESLFCHLREVSWVYCLKWKGLHVKNKWPLCHAWHHARALDVFLVLALISTPPAVQSYDSESSILPFMRGLIFFFLNIPFSRPLLKDKPRLRKGKMTDYHYLSASPLLKTALALSVKKGSLWRRTLRSQKGFGLGRRGSSRDSVGMKALLHLHTWLIFKKKKIIPNSLLCLQKEENVEMQTWMYMQDVSFRLPIVCPSFHSPGALQWWLKTEERARTSRGTEIDFVEYLFFFCPVEVKLERVQLQRWHY